MVTTVGVLALQGAFALHLQAIERLAAAGLAVRGVPVKTAAELADVDALIMPGGESTTMSMLLDSQQLFAPLQAAIDDGLPVFGTCAGMILLASDILDGRDDQNCFGALDIKVRRNAYGAQVESFETDLAVSVLDEPFPAVFIRAPGVETVGGGVDVVSEHRGEPVLCRSGAVLASSFHPELTDDDRLHRYFLESVVGVAAV